MKKIFLFICLFLLPCCNLTKPIIRNFIEEGIFLGYEENSSRKMCLEVVYFNNREDYIKAKGLNVVEDRHGFSTYAISLYELLDDDVKGKKYDFYNLTVSGENEKEGYYYEDDNGSTFKPITSLPNSPLGSDSYYLIDYFNSDKELEFSLKLYTEEKFNDIYKNN